MDLKVEGNEPKRKNSVLSVILKGFLWMVASLLFLIMLVLILIQTSFVQNFARKKIVSYLQNKLHTKVEIGKLDIDFPTTLSLQNIFIEDLSKDTLLYGKELRVNMDMGKLISSNIDIKKIELNGLVAKVKRLPPDSVFNFQFIVDAFSSPDTLSKTPKDTSSLQMNIDEIVVNKTRIIYKDLFTGNDMDLTFGHFETKISKFDPSHLLFDIPSITLNGLHGYFHQLEPLEQPVKKTVSEAAAAPDNYLQLLNKVISLSDIDVAFISEASHLNTSFVIGKAEIHPETIDLKNSVVSLKDASLHNSDIRVATNSKATNEKPKDTITTAPETPSMKIFAGSVAINNLNIKYDDQSAPKAPSGMDYSHLGITGLSIKGSNIEYSTDTILASIQSGSMKEKSGFVLNNLVTDFSMNPTGVSLKNLLIQTPGSDIKNEAVISYPSLVALSNDPGKLGLNINLQNSKIAIKDLLTFVPQLKSQTASMAADATIFVDTKITGQVNNMNFQRLILKGLSATDINVNGVVRGLPNPDALYTDLNINKFQTSGRDIISLLPPNTLPQNISIPTALSASGKIKGGMKDLYANLSIKSSSGNAAVDGSLQNITDKIKAKYDLVLHTNGLQLGSIMKNPKLGAMTGNFKVKGSGLDPKTANATFSAVIPTIVLNDYNYHHIQVNGNLANENYTIIATVSDPNLTARIDGAGNFSGEYPTLKLKSTIDSIKTLALNLTSQRIIYHGKIDADFSNLDPDHLEGNLNITHSILVTDSNRITLDSLSLIASGAAESENISIKSDFLNISVKGKYKLTQLGDIFQQVIQPYYALSGTRDTATIAPYDFTINAAIIDNKALHSFLPTLRELRTINMEARLSSENGLNMNFKSPRIVYGSLVIDSLNFDAETKDSALVFNTSLQKFSSGSSLAVYATTLDGKLQNNKLDYKLNIKDPKSKDKYRLSGSFDQTSFNQYIFSLKPDSILLNYDQWTINENNQIKFDSNNIHAQNFDLSQGNQHLVISSEGTQPNAPLTISFKDFTLETLSGFIQNDSSLVNGLLNGSAVIKNLQTQPTFTTDLIINNLSVYQDTIGTLTAKVNNNVANKYEADVRLEGNGNDLKINGVYNVNPVNSSFDFVVDMANLQMKTLQGLSQGAIKDASGNLYGKIAINGSLDNPNIDGKLHFNDVALNVTTLNNVFKVDNEGIAIVNNEGIRLQTFTIRDASNNAIVIDGMLNSKDFMNYTFDLKVNANNFQALNSSSKDNPLFYGKMVFSTNLTVTGTPNLPKIDGSLVINKKTDFTAVLPQNTVGIEKRKGIVRFVDRSATMEDSLFMAPYDSLKKAPLQGFDVSLNIRIDKEAIFNMIVDAGSGDFLRLQGVGELTGGVDPSGKITLTGSYEIDDGTYNLSYNFIKRKFNIQKGSKIVWTGEPTTGLLDLTAIYISNTAPIDLVQGQIESANQTIYKQKLPFQVALKLQGEILQPQISFDVILPENQSYQVSSIVTSTVRTKLAQLRQEPNEMNKQVFALLLLNRFVGEDPFASSGGSTSAKFVAMQSASRLLSEQLDRLTSNLIPGVDVNADLATSQDYTTGTEQERTDLNVGLTKRLLDDRLSVTVGSDFQLQGPDQTNRQQNSLAGNISINYKLTKDGRYEVRVYRKNDYTGQLEGYVIETGIGFIVSVDFNRFSQIFMSKDQRRKKRKIIEHNKEVNKAESQQEIEDKSITPPSKAANNDQ
ncbi:MAG: translocation/assembly module TamB domain-containing protein [Ginsengibacter sp.]